MDHKTNAAAPFKFPISRTKRGNESKSVSNVTNVTDDTRSYCKDTISDSAVSLDISEIQIDDSGCIAGISRNAVLAAFNSTESLSSSNTGTIISSEEEKSEDEVQMDNKLNVTEAGSIYVLQAKERSQIKSRSTPLAESTRTNIKGLNELSSSRKFVMV